MINYDENARILCLTHTDNDGIACGFLVKRKYPNARVIPINYGRPVNSSWFDDIDIVFVTDFSFDSLETLKQLDSDPFQLIWIDHHVCIEEAEKTGFKPEGLRRTDCSAAKLTWEYLYPKESVPKVIKCISDYDTWQLDKNPDALMFHYGIGLTEFSLTNKKSEVLFQKMITDDTITDRIISDGKEIDDYVKYHHKLVVDDGAFETELCGYKGIACNIKNVNSLLFQSLDEKYKDIPLRILFAYFANINQYRVSVFSNDEKVSAHEICRQFNGGGHAGAAGFACSVLPFKLPEISDEPHSIDIYQYIEPKVLFSPVLRIYTNSGNVPLMLSHRFASIVGTYSAICVNNPTGSVDAFYATGDNRMYQIGVFYNLMNNGKYRYRCHILDPSLNPVDVAKSLKTEYPLCLSLANKSIVFITDKSPLRIA